MDYGFIIFAFVLIAMGIAGSFLPVLPGPPLAYTALPVVHYFTEIQISTPILITYLILAVIITILDFAIPAWMVAKSGGSKAGSSGSVIGMLIGFFIVPAIGVFIGAFVGAMIGELRAGKGIFESLAAGWWSFVGFLAGSLIKFIYCLAVAIQLAIVIYKFSA